MKLSQYLTIILAFYLRSYICNDLREEDETISYYASENSIFTFTEDVTSAISNSSTLHERYSKQCLQTASINLTGKYYLLIH